MEDSVSSHLNSWEEAQETPTMFYSADGFVGLLSAYLVLGMGSFILFVFCCQKKRLGVLFCCGHGRLKGFQNVRTFLLALLIMDFIHSVVTLIYVIDFAQNVTDAYFNWLSATHSVWILSRYFMVVLQLLMALTSIYYLCDPSSEGKLCCMVPFPCFFMTVVLIVIFSIIYILVTPYIVISLGPLTLGLVLAIILKNRFSREFHLITAWRKPIVFVAIISVLVSFLPSFIFHCLVLSQQVYASPFYLYFQFGTNIELFLDSLLCFFILKLPVEEEPRCQRPVNVSTVSQPGGGWGGRGWGGGGWGGGDGGCSDGGGDCGDSGDCGGGDCGGGDCGGD